MIRKSILTLMLLAFIGGVTAQSLQFELNGHVYADGEEITCNNDEYSMGEIIQHMQVRNLTDQDLDVIIEKEIVQDLEGTSNSFCFGLCYGSDTFISNPVSVAAQSLNDAVTADLTFHVSFFDLEGNIYEGAVVVKYYAYSRTNPDEKVSIVVKFVYNPSDVNENVASISPAYPNPATSVVRFNVEGVANANIAIYNLLGQEVLNQNVEAGQVAISVADLEKGIYFCNLMVEGKTVSTEKLIVK